VAIFCSGLRENSAILGRGKLESTNSATWTRVYPKMSFTLATHRAYKRVPARATQPDIFREMHAMAMPDGKPVWGKDSGSWRKIMHKNLPRRALKCFVKRALARSRALPARAKKWSAQSYGWPGTRVREMDLRRQCSKTQQAA